jgi:hypothetical protein
VGDGTHYNPGAALEAERIAFQTRKLVADKKPIQMTGNHKGTRGTLQINSYAVIDRAFKTVRR